MVFVGVADCVLAQHKPQAEYSLSLAAGGTVANSSALDYTHAVDFGIVGAVDWRMTGDEYWKRFWNHPSFGTHIEYLHTLGGIAGDRVALAFQMSNPLWESVGAYPRHQLFWYSGAGVAVFTEPYERTLDTLNKFIGSYLNCIFNLGLGYRAMLDDNSELTFTLRFSHSSNGYMLKPNKGLNFILATAGYCFKPQGRGEMTAPDASVSIDTTIQDTRCIVPTSRFRKTRTPFMSHRLWVSFAPTAVQSRYIAATKDYYFAYTGQIGYGFNINPCIGFGANLDIMYNSSHSERLINEFHKEPSPPYLGAALSVEPRWGIMSVRLSVGYYLRRAETVSIPMYERLGVFFHFGDKVSQFAGVTIKAHAAHADYIEWHYGIELFVSQPKRKTNTSESIVSKM